VRVLDPGLMTTVQDLGRFGYQKDGVTSGGAMDPLALRIANVLVGNEENEAALEMTLKGPTIEFLHDSLIAICGADLSANITDLSVPDWCAISVKEGAILAFGDTKWGCRAYLAITGGINVPEVMNSKSTYLRAAIGGIDGLPLQAGCEVPVGAGHTGTIGAGASGPLPFALTERSLRTDDALGFYERDRPLRVLRGPHWGLFDKRDRSVFLNEVFEVSDAADRMGYRLSGPLLDSGKRDELISSAVSPGTVQVPPSGEPIVLMADRQTTGGYPVIGVVATADLPLVAQLRPGDEVRFEEVTIERAQTALRSQAERMRSIKEEVASHVPDRS
jgi:antagonist of KipI